MRVNNLYLCNSSRGLPCISDSSPPLAPADFEIKVERIAHSIVHFDQRNKLISKM